MKLVLTCEHAGNLIPDDFTELFPDAKAILNTHRGFDPGAYDLYSHLKRLATYSRSHKESRLLIELNRSLHHPALFSEFTQNASSEIKNRLINDYYLPYRNNVEASIAEYIQEGEEVLHLSIHSFTPQLNGKIRNADIGLLYDPKRKGEKDWCAALKYEIKKRNKSLRLRFNYPYRGSSDGFTTYLRNRYPQKYLGIEIEVNQNFVDENRMDQHLKSSVFSAIEALTLS